METCIRSFCSMSAIPRRFTGHRGGRRDLESLCRGGGALTGEHGIGIEKREFLDLVFSPDDLDAMAKVRGAFNPDGRLNPGKLLPFGGNCCPHLHQPDTEARLRMTKTRGASV
jgi:hypothetical protein